MTNPLLPIKHITNKSRPSGGLRTRPSDALRTRPSGGLRTRPLGVLRTRPSGGPQGSHRNPVGANIYR